MTTGLWVLLGVALAALAFGLYRAWADGRFRGTHPVRGAVAPESTATTADDDANVQAGTAPAGSLGQRATLLQFSSAFCAPCRATRQVLSAVAEQVPGVRHVEIDAEHHLDLVRRLGVLRTPTTLVLDGSGRELSRAGGAPRREQVLAALAEVAS